jgi:peptidoglycan-associated lipoprotein
MNRTIIVCSVASLALTFSCAKKTPPAEEPVVAQPERPAAKTEDAAAPQDVQKIIANFQRIHFDFNSSELTAGTRNALMENVELLRKNATVKVEIQGHCDARGTSEYNLALGDKRARAVVDYMVRAGIEQARLTLVSYGKERPLEDAESETAWAKNRRAEFRVTWVPQEVAEIHGTTD